MYKFDFCLDITVQNQQCPDKNVSVVMNMQTKSYFYTKPGDKNIYYVWNVQMGISNLN